MMSFLQPVFKRLNCLKNSHNRLSRSKKYLEPSVFESQFVFPLPPSEISKVACPPDPCPGIISDVEMHANFQAKKQNQEQNITAKKHNSKNKVDANFTTTQSKKSKNWNTEIVQRTEPKGQAVQKMAKVKYNLQTSPGELLETNNDKEENSFSQVHDKEKKSVAMELTIEAKKPIAKIAQPAQRRQISKPLNSSSRTTNEGMHV